jgi:hypothetical protein
VLDVVDPLGAQGFRALDVLTPTPKEVFLGLEVQALCIEFGPEERSPRPWSCAYYCSNLAARVQHVGIFMLSSNYEKVDSILLLNLH